MLLLLLYITSSTALSIGATSDKGELNEPKEFYPNWVPFKNKHGDELGEFLDVAPKAKVKKRLAPPMNFILRAVAEPDGDDYYDKGQGEGDSEDYFEKKDWSDLNRPVQVEDTVNEQAQQNLSDIDGIVHLITQPNRHNLARAIQESVQNSEEKEGLNDNGITEKPEVQKSSGAPVVKTKLATKSDHKYEDDIDYEDSAQPTKRRKQESSEEEAEKKNILDSVDDLKDRHAAEQRTISEKAKEEEFNTEVHERDQMQARRLQDKYADRINSKRRGVTSPDYEEYDEKGSWRDKYARKDKSTLETTTQKLTTIKEPKKLSVFKSPHLYIIDDDSDEVTTKKIVPTKPVNKNALASLRFSAKFTTTEKAPETFIGPQTTPDSEPTLFFPKLKHKRRRKMKLKTTEAPDSSVAETVKAKNARRPMTKSAQRTTKTTQRTTKTSEPMTETTTPVTTEVYKTTDIVEQPTESRYVTVRDEDHKTTPNDFVVVGGDRITDAASSNTNTFTDAVPAATDHEKEEPKEYHVEKGGGHEHHSSHEEEHEEHGKKAYEKESRKKASTHLPRRRRTRLRKTTRKPTTKKANVYVEDLRRKLRTRLNVGNQKPWYYHYDIDGLHKDAKSKKGHHDKEDHLGKYEDRGGYNKEHSDEKKHYGAHHHEEHGKKHAKYEESGKHSKGHSTKGSHDIHKKEEYEKNVEFFEEEGDSAEEEKHGGFNEEKEHKSGGKFAKGHQQAKNEERKKGESGHYEKGAHSDAQKGYKQSGGRDHHGKDERTRQAAEGHQGGKKWIYHHGFPAKTSNLVIIDRRGDKFAHGPTYFG